MAGISQTSGCDLRSCRFRTVWLENGEERSGKTRAVIDEAGEDRASKQASKQAGGNVLRRPCEESVAGVAALSLAGNLLNRAGDEVVT